eukprot:gb/GECG01007806.1/.p1 GENE.gb/GECG01007806.1/~~gb/GECG01007806.1/.p1  ORF type:complete len:255 (+),score=38.00 gb/GECG01007806.1/:1-765(+)
MPRADMKAVHYASREVARTSLDRAKRTVSQLKAQERHPLKHHGFIDGGSTGTTTSAGEQSHGAETLQSKKALGPYSRMLIAHADLYAKPSGNTLHRPEDAVPRYPYTDNLLNAVIYAMADDPEQLCYELVAVAEECRRVSSENEKLRHQVDEIARYRSTSMDPGWLSPRMTAAETDMYFNRPNSSPTRKKDAKRSTSGKRDKRSRQSSTVHGGRKEAPNQLSHRNAAALEAYSKAGMEKKRNIDKKIAEKKRVE